MGPPAQGRGALFVGDSTWDVRGGRVVRARQERNPLFVWGFDVYTQPPAETLRVLGEMAPGRTAFREDTWDGASAYVLGTPETGEVWVERDRLLFRRLVEAQPDGTVQDVRFENYQPLAGGWIAPYVEVRVGDRIVFWETYADVEAGVPLDPALFDPRRWAEGAAAGADR